MHICMYCILSLITLILSEPYQLKFYHTVHYGAKHGLAIACCLPVCDIGGS